MSAVMFLGFVVALAITARLLLRPERRRAIRPRATRAARNRAIAHIHRHRVH